ncbi:hypothetical protein BFS06_11545 [Clostridium perfringens]|uniref:hypothetical protein n=1 Tax=Clostridium perfringens TaxID=1502 RepID=UPI00103C3FB1|nr:hypothetical protein [Clostridium perfringens]TBX14848.1 hypothetical protein BFS06_11545 [Clostridium perfringens]
MFNFNIKVKFVESFALSLGIDVEKIYKAERLKESNNNVFYKVKGFDLLVSENMIYEVGGD